MKNFLNLILAFFCGSLFSLVLFQHYQDNQQNELAKACPNVPRNWSELEDMNFDINTSVSYRDGKTRPIILSVAFEEYKCSGYDEDLILFFLKNGGRTNLAELNRIYNEAQKRGNEEIIGIIESAIPE